MSFEAQVDYYSIANNPNMVSLMKVQSMLSAIRNWNHPSAFKNHPVLEHAISKTMREYYEGEYDIPNFHEGSASANEISFSVSYTKSLSISFSTALFISLK
mmetsp:Transcript_35921/g.45716  ORF Transcript_35921/g.45716 Transcript_35921/m.45716 type:complete len:101 (+) Transcript_35921:121-423(+)